MMLALMVRKRLAEVTLEAAEAELRAQRMEAALRGEGAAEGPKKPHLLHSPAIPNSWAAQAGHFIAMVFAAANALQLHFFWYSPFDIHHNPLWPLRADAEPAANHAS